MWAPFIWAVCGPHLKNRGLLDNDTMSSQFGYALESEILILNELKEPDAKERRALANKLKPIIAAPPDMLTVNRKGLHPYQMANRVFVLAFSNDPVPISLDSQDRRWMCVWSHAPRMAADAAARMWDWYKAGGFAAVGAWLQARDQALDQFKSSAYSDSINDLPLLSAVQRPVAVDPDARLRQEAMQRGWQILELAR
jgi:hypothetical protein